MDDVDHGAKPKKPTETLSRVWLDECVPAGVFDDEQSEQLWDACCASHPDDPFLEWEKRKGASS